MGGLTCARLVPRSPNLPNRHHIRIIRLFPSSLYPLLINTRNHFSPSVYFSPSLSVRVVSPSPVELELSPCRVSPPPRDASMPERG